jgi:hypothetical protein
LDDEPGLSQDQRAEAAMDLWSKEAEKDHQNDVYATRDDRKDEHKDKDRDENKDKDKDEGSSRARNRVTEERDGNKNSVDSEVESGTINKDPEDRIKAMLSDLLQHG